MIHGAANKYAVSQLRHLYGEQRLRNASVVRSFIRREKGRHGPRNIDRVKDVPDGDPICDCVGERNSGSIAADKETGGIVMVVEGGAKAAGEWVEEVKRAREGGCQVMYDSVL